jgi:hypothetical protein
MSDEEVVEEEPLSKEVVINMLIAIAVNSCQSTYDKTHIKVREHFYALPVKDILQSWEWLNQASKIKVIDSKRQFFDDLIKDYLDNE